MGTRSPVIDRHVPQTVATDARAEIIYLWPYLEWGGAQIYFFGLMKWIGQGYSVSALMPQGSHERLVSYLQELEVPFALFAAHTTSAASSLGQRLLRRWHKLYCEFVLLKVLGKRALRRTVIHADIAPWNSFWLLLYLALRSQVVVTIHTAIPTVSHLRNLIWVLKFRLLTSLAGFRLLASNQDARNSMQRFVAPSVYERIPVAYSGVDTAEVRNLAASATDRLRLCQRLGLPHDKLMVLTMGQFIERKGCWVLLEAARSLLSTRADLHFVWLGTAELSAETLQRIQATGAAAAFTYLTPAGIGPDRAALLATLMLADIFVLASFVEGLPIALTEAMALGKACIASNINAIPEAIRDHVTGLLVNAGDSDGLARAIELLASDSELRARLGQAAAELVPTRFDERLAAQTTRAVYDELLAQVR